MKSSPFFSFYSEAPLWYSHHVHDHGYEIFQVDILHNKTARSEWEFIFIIYLTYYIIFIFTYMIRYAKVPSFKQ